MLLGQILDQRHLGLGDFVAVNTRDTNPFFVNMEHYLDCLGVLLVKNILEHLNDEFLGSIIVIVQQNFVQRGFF